MDISVVLILAGWGIAYRWGYVKGRDEWRSNYDVCMKAKTKAIKKGSPVYLEDAWEEG